MKIKLPLVISVILICVCLFCGCAQVDFTYVQQKSGGYRHVIDVTLDEDFSCGDYTVGTALDKIDEIFCKKGYTVEVRDTENRRITAYKEFASLQAVSKDILGDGVENEISSDSRDLLFDYRTTKGKIALTDAHKRKILLSLTEFDLNCPELFFDVNKIRTTYTVKTPFKSVTSNADEVVKSGKYYVHKWKNPAEKNYEIITTSRKPRAVVWYVGSVVFAVAVGSCVAVAGYKKAKKKHNSDETDYV